MVMASSQSVCKHISMFGYFLIGNSVIWSFNYLMVYKTATSKRIRLLTVKRRMDDKETLFQGLLYHFRFIQSHNIS